MFKNPFAVVCLLSLAAAAPLRAQTNPTGDPTPQNEDRAGETATPGRFWQASLPGGSYMVALDRITSVSRHKYLLDGALVVDEVTVDTLGQAIARFYLITPVSEELKTAGLPQISKRVRDAADGAAQRAGSDLQNMVVKKYPETTHAKTIEYRVNTEAELASLYDSVRNAWENSRGRKFTVK